MAPMPCCASTSTCTLTESCSLLALEAGVSLPAAACHAHRTFGGPCVWPPAAVPDFADGSAPEAACDAAYAVARAGRGFGPCVWRDGGCVNRAEDPCSS